MKAETIFGIVLGLSLAYGLRCILKYGYHSPIALVDIPWLVGVAFAVGGLLGATA